MRHIVILFLLLVAIFVSASAAEPEKLTLMKTGEKINQPEYIKNEYILTLQKAEDEANIKTAFQKYEMVSVKSLGKNMFLIKLKKDPGQEALEKEFKDVKYTFVLQRNYKYQNLKKKKAPAKNIIEKIPPESSK